MYAGTGDQIGFTPVSSAAKIEDPVPDNTSIEVKESVPVVPANGDAEVSPLLPQLPLPGQVEESTKKITGRFPLKRQQSAPPGSFFANRASTPGSFKLKNVRPVVDSVAEIPEFPDVELRKKNFVGRRSRPNSGESTHSGSLDPDVTAQAFRKALRSTSSNPYKRVN